ncbi:MAG: PAS domain S-box protein [Deltaproteobacteria bacterium]|nr:PAS domain S-box protein [Deltaproteobacteria bacterium]
MDIGKHWETIIETLQDSVLVIDPEGNIMSINPAAERLTGYSSEELLGFWASAGLQFGNG